LFSFTSSDANVTDKIDSGDRRRSSTIAGTNRPEFVKHMTDRTPEKKSTKTSAVKPKSARKMSNNRINSRSPKKREKTRTKSKSPQNHKNGILLDKLDEFNELTEQTRKQDDQALLEILKQYGIDDIDITMKTSKVNNARPILDLEKLEQEEKAKFLSAGRRNNNRSPSPHTRKSVINYFDDAKERTNLKSFQVGDFTSSTTSSMPIRYIQKEIRRVLKKLAIEYHIKDYVYTCKSKIKDEDIEYVIEIVNITDFEHLKGLVFKKVEGSDGTFDQHHKLILDNVNI
jgi:hypothetical protein